MKVQTLGPCPKLVNQPVQVTLPRILGHPKVCGWVIYIHGREGMCIERDTYITRLPVRGGPQLERQPGS